MRELYIFYDTNFFSGYPVDDLKEILKTDNHILISPVLEELKIGRTKRNRSAGLDYILDDDLQLKQPFKVINLDNCDKDDSYLFEISDLMYLKKNPILCSSYFTWINSATNPAIVLDFFRQMFNEILYEVKKDSNDSNNLSKLESNFRGKEIEMVEKFEKRLGRERKIEYKWLMQARKKRVKEAKEGKFKLTDYQILVTALLMACFYGENVVVNTLDRDLVDIKENLERSIIERYVVYHLLQEKIKKLPTTATKVFSSVGLLIDLSIADIGENVRTFWNKLNSEKEFIVVGLLLYNNKENLCFPYHIKIPYWLRDFILDYKKNVSCMSLNSSYSEINNFRYTFNPNYEKDVVTYTIYPNNYYQDRMTFPFCSKFCRYAKTEESKPHLLSEFLG